MSKKPKLSDAQMLELKKVRKCNKDTNVDNRLKALLLYGEGVKHKAIADKTGFVTTYITELAGKYRKGGIDAVAGNNYKGNRRNLTFDQEVALLLAFKEKATKGQMVEVKEIVTAYEQATGKSLEKSNSQIYYVLARHGWRKVMPRSKHPKRATEAEIEASCRGI